MTSPAVLQALAEVAGADVCDLLTMGRSSGSPHTVELWFAADAGRIAFLAGGRERADWVRNLRALGEAEVTIDRHRFSGRVDWAEGTDREALVRRALAAKYQGWTEGRPLSGWARGALAVEIVVERLVENG